MWGSLFLSYRAVSSSQCTKPKPTGRPPCSTKTSLTTFWGRRAQHRARPQSNSLLFKRRNRCRTSLRTKLGSAATLSSRSRALLLNPLQFSKIQLSDPNPNSRHTKIIMCRVAFTSHSLTTTQARSTNPYSNPSCNNYPSSRRRVLRTSAGSKRCTTSSGGEQHEIQVAMTPCREV